MRVQGLCSCFTPVWKVFRSHFFRFGLKSSINIPGCTLHIRCVWETFRADRYSFFDICAPYWCTLVSHLHFSSSIFFSILQVFTMFWLTCYVQWTWTQCLCSVHAFYISFVRLSVPFITSIFHCALHLSCMYAPSSFENQELKFITSFGMISKWK